MRCTNCGTDNPNDSMFCMECGTKMTRPSPVVPAPVASGPVAPAPGAPAPVAPGPVAPGPAQLPPQKVSPALMVTAPSTPPAAAVRPSGGKNTGCPTCGVDNDPRDTFCKMCGATLGAAQETRKMTEFCRFCGKPIPEKDAFCPHCGRRHRQPHSPTPPGGMPAVAAGPAVAPPAAAPAAPVQAAFAPPVMPAPLPVQPAAVLPPTAEPPSAQRLVIMNQPQAVSHASGCTLCVLQGHRAGERFPFTKTLTLGRHVGEILFGNDEYLDARHVVLSSVPEGVLVQDMNTINGVYYHATGDCDLVPGLHFMLGDQLFQFCEVGGHEWSLNNVWERGVKLMGSLRNDRPWGRLLHYSPQGVVAGSMLLWQDIVQLDAAHWMPALPATEAPGCRLVNRKGSTVLSAGNSEVFVRVKGQASFRLPIRLRMGLQIIEISPS